MNYADQAGLYFETSDQIKDRLFHDTNCADQEKDLYYPDFSLMGGFDNLRNLWEDLKRNGVRQR